MNLVSTVSGYAHTLLRDANGRLFGMGAGFPPLECCLLFVATGSNDRGQLAQPLVGRTTATRVIGLKLDVNRIEAFAATVMLINSTSCAPGYSGDTW